MMNDLTPLAKDLEKVFKKHFPKETERIALAIAFSLAADYGQAYFITTVPRPMGIQLFKAAAQKMSDPGNQTTTI